MSANNVRQVITKIKAFNVDLVTAWPIQP